MVARLWWKDLRQFWPIWALIAIVALVAQRLIVHYASESARTGELAGFALGWTCLYAFAVAAAAFAGERENRTLGWLDAIPVGRSRIWVAKATFAAASTLALGLVLLAAAATDTDKWVSVRPFEGIITGLAVLLIVLGCGLLWSSVTNNALLAAVLSIGTSLVILPLLQSWLRPDAPPWRDPFSILAIVVCSWLASWLMFVWTAPPRLGFVDRGLSSLLGSSGRATTAVEAQAMRPPSFWGPAARSLAWQTWREARSFLAWFLLIGVLVPVAAAVAVGRPMDLMGWIGGSLLVSLVAGISVFGNDHRRGTQRMLANHGARPAQVWLIRVLIWAAVVLGVTLCAILTGLVWSEFSGRAAFVGSVATNQWPWTLFLAALSFSIPVLCGMVFPRGITAGVVAILLWFLAWIPLIGLLLLNLLPSIFALLIPLAILGVSLAWSGDWLIERPGAGRWLRLAAWSLGLFAAVLAAYATVRITEVPRLDPAREAELLRPVAGATVPETDNAAPLYRKAAAALSPMPKDAVMLDSGGSAPLNSGLIDWLHKNQDCLALLRQAAAKPDCQFAGFETMTVFSGWDSVPPLHVVPGLLLEASVRDRMAKGDLDGAWKDIETCFRFARHRMRNAPIWNATSAQHDERRALRLAMVWAADTRQTVSRLQAARATYGSLPRPDAIEPIRVEAQILRNTEELSRRELVAKMLEMSVEPRRQPDTAEVLRIDLMTTPWELARARRAWRLVLASKAEQAGREPWQAPRRSWTKLAVENAPTVTILAPASLELITKSTPLIQHVLPPLDEYILQWDRNEVGRRALVQILAIRTWQLKHDGRLPSELLELVTDGEIDRLPTDPYTPNHLFGYVQAAGQSVLPLDDAYVLWAGPNQSPRARPITAGRLLYSVGPDQKDDHATRNDEPQLGGDIIFPLVASAPTPK
jgi:hypothetical protein